jgi:hypothetical protein
VAGSGGPSCCRGATQAAAIGDLFHGMKKEVSYMKTNSKVHEEYIRGNPLSARFLLKRELLSDYGLSNL